MLAFSSKQKWAKVTWGWSTPKGPIYSCQKCLSVDQIASGSHLPTHLSDVGLGQYMSDHFSNFPKLMIWHSKLHRRIEPFSLASLSFSITGTTIFHVYNQVQCYGCFSGETHISESEMCAVVPIFKQYRISTLSMSRFLFHLQLGPLGSGINTFDIWRGLTTCRTNYLFSIITWPSDWWNLGQVWQCRAEPNKLESAMS